MNKKRDHRTIAQKLDDAKEMELLCLDGWILVDNEWSYWKNGVKMTGNRVDE